MKNQTCSAIKKIYSKVIKENIYLAFHKSLSSNFSRIFGQVMTLWMAVVLVMFVFGCDFEMEQSCSYGHNVAQPTCVGGAYGWW